MAVTWRETHRHVRVTVTVAVTGAPAITGLLPGVTISPFEVTVGIIDGEPRTVGMVGNITKGEGSRSGTPMAKVWPWREAPEWMRELAGEVL
jgi:hypothetical protein